MLHIEEIRRNTQANKPYGTEERINQWGTRTKRSASVK